MSFGDDLNEGIQDIGSWFGEGGPPKIPDADRNNFNLPGQEQRANSLNSLAQRADMRFAPESANDSSFRGDQQGLVNRLRGQMNGQDSMSQLQLRGATDQNIAQQRSLAASASPSNAAMAQRMAMQNIGQQNQGFGNQAAMLGIQERNAAAGMLGQVAQGARGQDQQNNQFNVGAQLQQTGMNDQRSGQARQQELQNAQLQQQGMMGYEQNNTARLAGQQPGSTNGEKVLDTAVAAAPYLLSDERLKTGVSTPSGGSLDSLIAHLKPQEFSYKDASMGAGPRMGVMAQDVEQGGRAGQQMISDDGGAKMLDVNKSLGTALGLIGRLGERLDRMDGGGGGGERAMAQGGIVTQPTHALIGEAGPEAVVPLSGLIGENSAQWDTSPTDLRGQLMPDDGAKKRKGLYDASQASGNKWVRGIGGIVNAYQENQAKGKAQGDMQSSLMERLKAHPSAAGIGAGMRGKF